LTRLGEQFEKYGDIRRAFVLTSPMCMSSKTVLQSKAQAIKQFALLRGTGSWWSTGEFWIRQRRMIQPAFNPTAVNALASVITRIIRGRVLGPVLPSQKHGGRI
jgi:cytochrome P450